MRLRLLRRDSLTPDRSTRRAIPLVKGVARFFCARGLDMAIEAELEMVRRQLRVVEARVRESERYCASLPWYLRLFGLSYLLDDML